MEKRIQQKIEDYSKQMQNAFEEYIDGFHEISHEDKKNIIQFLIQYPTVNLEKDDFLKRKRIKNVVPYHDRCMAKRANGERCTRRKKEETEYCGTHTKGQPHGVITDEPPKEEFKTLVVKAQDIKGIIYYLDDIGNVYDSNDILNGTKNPKIIAKYTKTDDGNYSIPAFGL